MFFFWVNIIDKLTQELLKEELLYEETTGKFYWLKPKQGRKLEKPAGHSGGGYVTIGINGRNYLAHRLAFLYMTGSWPVEYVDHIDGNPRNNKWSNLRPATAAENSYNKKRKYDSFTGIKGVVQDFRSNTWHVHMQIDGKIISRGPFYSYQDACKEYDRLAKNARGEWHRPEPPRQQRANFSTKDVTNALEDFIDRKLRS